MCHWKIISIKKQIEKCSKKRNENRMKDIRKKRKYFFQDELFEKQIYDFRIKFSFSFEPQEYLIAHDILQ